MRTHFKQPTVQFLSVCFIVIGIFAFQSTVLAQTPIDCGITIASSISVASEEDDYTFTASVNDYVTIRLIRTSDTALDPYLRLYNPSGGLVTSNYTTSSNYVRIDWQLTRNKGDRFIILPVDFERLAEVA